MKSLALDSGSMITHVTQDGQGVCLLWRVQEAVDGQELEVNNLGFETIRVVDVDATSERKVFKSVGCVVTGEPEDRH